MTVSLDRDDRRPPYPVRVAHGRCRACDRIAPLADLEPVGTSLDLGDLLAGLVMCADEAACVARARTHYGDVLYAVVVDDEQWAGGQISLVTRDPRRATRYARGQRAGVVRWPIHSDYREG